MRWTNRKPTKPGLYLFHGTLDQTFGVSLIEIDENGVPSVKVVNGSIPIVDEYWESMEGQWHGPFTAPHVILDCKKQKASGMQRT